ncbi:Ankyrin repeat-containing protein like [Verticillium longisporum]|uniref:Ankyrin repeat-containing protein like n=1 Tax=Verticillium longisporum TaxID=100787 RepID=A0A0G4NE62_VERLO|nr:Ankyrin repeat-containing protein like [Verticillium longisporum]KAG7138295.1 Ankyrin repeat-containing protein like [Verticillium longisporum]RBQ87217.1 hypothetical protein VDGD_01909 [Verticillium dahliae]CRJ79426.1 hypothetical protein BN1708_000013 [Verticillium longisporum]CRK44767.1 hypothetical protein BN1723_006293 [Verticillium longisporum]
MAGDDEVHEGASTKELLIEACRRNNTDLFQEIVDGIPDEEQLSKILNETTTVLGNHLYHEAAAGGHYEIIDLLLDQPNFECDPVTRIDRDTPLHTAIRWLNGQPRANWPFGASLVDMMLEAGSSPRVKNKGGLTPLQLVDPANKELRDLIQKHEYAALNAGDFVNVEPAAPAQGGKANQQQHHQQQEVESDEDAEFSGSDDDERAEWERRRKERRAQRG